MNTKKLMNKQDILMISFVCNDFLKHAKYYQSSEFLLYYYYGYVAFPLKYSIEKEKVVW